MSSFICISYVDRDTEGKYRPDAVSNAVKDIDKVQSLTGNNISSFICFIIIITSFYEYECTHPYIHEVTADYFSYASV